MVGRTAASSAACTDADAELATSTDDAADTDAGAEREAQAQAELAAQTPRQRARTEAGVARLQHELYGLDTPPSTDSEPAPRTSDEERASTLLLELAHHAVPSTGSTDGASGAIQTDAPRCAQAANRKPAARRAPARGLQSGAAPPDTR